MDRCGRGCRLTFRTVGCLPGGPSPAPRGSRNARVGAEVGRLTGPRDASKTQGRSVITTQGRLDIAVSLTELLSRREGGLWAAIPPFTPSPSWPSARNGSGVRLSLPAALDTLCVSQTAGLGLSRGLAFYRCGGGSALASRDARSLPGQPVTGILVVWGVLEHQRRWPAAVTAPGPLGRTQRA
jgi:hypothetical protein